jgi:hypothetical protein
VIEKKEKNVNEENGKKEKEDYRKKKNKENTMSYKSSNVNLKRETKE